jgi:hypothetical protein
MKIVANGIEGKPDMSFDATYKRSVVYTTEGMYEQRKNKLWRVELKNQRLERVPYQNIEFMVDYTEMVYTDTLLHIPFEHICCEETIQKKNLGNSIVFVKRCYFDQTSYYFEVDGKLESFMFKEMFSFLL